jgi:hypothetical protein
MYTECTSGGNPVCLEDVVWKGLSGLLKGLAPSQSILKELQEPGKSLKGLAHSIYDVNRAGETVSGLRYE